MKRVVNPGTILRYDGDLVEVIGIAEGRTIVMRPLRRVGMEVLDTRCPHCGSHGDIHELEHSRNFQERAESVPTMVDPGGD